MNVLEATRSDEAWVARHTPLVRADIERKHALLAASPFKFLRGTFYRWVQLLPTFAPSNLIQFELLLIE